MSEQQHRVGLRALKTIGDVAPLDGLQTLVRAASEEFEVYAIPYQSIEALGEQAEGGDLEDAALLWCQGPEMADRQPLDLRGLAQAILAGRLDVHRVEGRWSVDVVMWEYDRTLIAAIQAWPDDFAALLREVHRGSP